MSAARDLLDGVECVQDAPNVRVEVPGGVPRIRVAPRDHEHLPALPDAELHEASPRGEVERVELVDRRGYDQHRNLIDLVGLRRVLDQLQYLVTEDDTAWRCSNVVAEVEAAAVDHLRKARCRAQVLHELLASACQAH